MYKYFSLGLKDPDVLAEYTELLEKLLIEAKEELFNLTSDKTEGRIISRIEEALNNAPK